jgi:hypothetical protein
LVVVAGGVAGIIYFLRRGVGPPPPKAIVIILLSLMVASLAYSDNASVVSQNISQNISIDSTGTSQVFLHPVFSSSYIAANENLSTFRFKIKNPFDSPTEPFRLSLSSNFSWFQAAGFTYALEPDGIIDNSPYWDIPPIMPDESVEISFDVKSRVGFSERIAMEIKKLDRWGAQCRYLVPYSGKNSTASAIGDFLSSINKTQNITVYYEAEVNGTSRLLAYLHDYGVFAAFEADYNKNGTYNVTALSDTQAISELVSAYASAATPAQQANYSSVTSVLKYTQNLKQNPETSCKILTGLENYPCTDRETCRLACYAVPVCYSIGQGGWAFIDTIMDYKDSIEYADSAFEAAIGSSEAFAARPSYENAGDALDEMLALNRAETTVIYHPLFTSYGFCPPAEYGLPQQLEAKRELLDYRETACLEGKKQMIIDDAVKVSGILYLQGKFIKKPTEITNQTASKGNVSVAPPAPKPETNSPAGPGIPEVIVGAVAIAIAGGGVWSFLIKKPKKGIL